MKKARTGGRPSASPHVRSRYIDGLQKFLQAAVEISETYHVEIRKDGDHVEVTIGERLEVAV